MSCRKISPIEYFLAFLIRIVLMQSNLQSAIQDRVEIATPLNSWKKLKEGIYLFESGVDPYTGDSFHETPLMLLVFRTLIDLFGPFLQVLFILIDLLTAYLLFQTACRYIIELKQHEEEIRSEDVKPQAKISAIDVNETPVLVAYAYLFNPYIVLNCAAQTTTGVSNLLHAGLLYSLVSRRKFTSVLLVALATLQSCYPLLLLVPICLQFYDRENPKTSVASIVISFMLTLGSLFGACHQVTGSWYFIDSIYWFILNVQDLTPNIGLFWYFFTEMFEHFRALFIAALQINATILYLIPLSLHLRKEPVFLTLILMALTAVFKSYPSLGDVGLYLALLPLWNHLFLFMQQLFIVGCMLIITSVLGPTVWHLWIYSGSANANFFFGVTLAFATAQIFLITDLLFAHKKREFALKHGWPEVTSKRVLILD